MSLQRMQYSARESNFRTVGFGTRFHSSQNTRLDDSSADFTTLCANEIAVDVGGVCTPSPLILDHHFVISGVQQAPSAAVLVLSHIENIRSLGQKHAEDGVWVVTHEQPDFDALCAAYLVRETLGGRIRLDGWEHYLGREHQSDKVQVPHQPDWFGLRSTFPSLFKTDEIDHAWPLILAAFASRTDEGKPIGVRHERRLDSVLQAGMIRGRDWTSNGAAEFFDWVRDRMLKDRLNPLIDDLFRGPSPFEAEVDLLDLEPERYQRDLKKGRRTIVAVQAEPFASWFSKVKSKPLRTKHGELFEVDPIHLEPHHPDKATVNRVFLDGFFIRDPESLLFKHWARSDSDNTRLKRGFTFLAIAYSLGRPARKGCSNTTDYWFSLDLERCGDAHLYNVWAKLQAAEEMSYKPEEYKESRRGFEGREVGVDPWFDGANFRATLVATSKAGVFHEPALKTATDLSDDAVATIVATELEYAAFGGGGADASYIDFSIAETPDTETRLEQANCEKLANAVDLPLSEQSYRLAYVPLVAAKGQLRPVASHIGEKLWPFLEKSGVTSRPDDFETRHLFCYEDRVVVWNRNGLAVAYIPHPVNASSKSTDTKAIPLEVEPYRKAMSSFVHIRRKVLEIATGASVGTRTSMRVATVAGLQRETAKLQLDAAKPTELPVRRLLEAMRIDEILSTLGALEQQEFAQAEKQRDDQLQATLAAVALIGILLAWMQVQQLHFPDGHYGQYIWGLLLLAFPIFTLIGLRRWEKRRSHESGGLGPTNPTDNRPANLPD